MIQTIGIKCINRSWTKILLFFDLTSHFELVKLEWPFTNRNKYMKHRNKLNDVVRFFCLNGNSIQSTKNFHNLLMLSFRLAWTDHFANKNRSLLNMVGLQLHLFDATLKLYIIECKIWMRGHARLWFNGNILGTNTYFGCSTQQIFTWLQ